MKLEAINTKLAWAVLIAGLLLSVMAGAFTLMTGNFNVLLVAMLGAVAAQAGKISLRDTDEAVTSPNERLKELVTA
jgi:hypothetical protein